MAIAETIKKMDTKNEVFKKNTSVGNDFLKNMIPLLLSGATTKNTNKFQNGVESLQNRIGKKNTVNNESMPNNISESKIDIVRKSISDNNTSISGKTKKPIDDGMKKMSAEIRDLNSINKEHKVVFGLVLDELKTHTDILKKIAINTAASNMNNGTRTSSDLLDVADDIFKKKDRNRNYNERSNRPPKKKGGSKWGKFGRNLARAVPLVGTSLVGIDDDDSYLDTNVERKERPKNKNKNTRKAQTKNAINKKVPSEKLEKLKASSKNVGNITKGGLTKSGNKLMKVASNILSSRGGQVAGTIIRAASPIAAVATAGMAGHAVGTAIYNNSSDGFKDAVGSAVANTLSFFGNKDAREAVRVNTNSNKGSSTEKVETVKVGKVTFPKDENVKKAIEFASKEFDIPLEEVLATAFQESGFNPNAKGSGSSAAGLFQFTTSTWDELRKKHPAIAEQFSIGNASSGDRFNPMKSAVMFGLLRNGNMKYLQKKGLTSGNPSVDSYLAHFLGMGGAEKVLGAIANGKGNDPISKFVSSDAFNAAGNKPLMKDSGGQSRSVNDFLKQIYNKSGARVDAYKEQVSKSGMNSDKKVEPDKVNNLTAKPDTKEDTKPKSGATNTPPSTKPAVAAAKPTATKESDKKDAKSTPSVSKSSTTNIKNDNKNVTNNVVQKTDNKTIDNSVNTNKSGDIVSNTSDTKNTVDNINVSPSTAINETNSLVSSLTDNSNISPNTAINETNSLVSSLTDNTVDNSNVSPSTAINETNSLVSSLTDNSNVSPSTAINETNSLVSSLTDNSNISPNTAINETNSLVNSLGDNTVDNKSLINEINKYSLSNELPKTKNLFGNESNEYLSTASNEKLIPVSDTPFGNFKRELDWDVMENTPNEPVTVSPDNIISDNSKFGSFAKELQTATVEAKQDNTQSNGNSNLVDNSSKQQSIPKQSRQSTTNNGGSIKASSNKQPQSARTIPPTLQRLLDKEYQRGI